MEYSMQEELEEERMFNAIFTRWKNEPIADHLAAAIEELHEDTPTATLRELLIGLEPAYENNPSKVGQHYIATFLMVELILKLKYAEEIENTLLEESLKNAVQALIPAVSREAEEELDRRVMGPVLNIDKAE